MKSPWRWSSPLEPDREYLVLVSSIPPRSRRSTWRLFRGASTVRRQLSVTEGVIGFSLLARPVRKQYATLSVWTGEDALARFAGADPHRDLMRRLAPEMGATKFVRWTIRGGEGRPSWDNALQRLS
jgi:hypothetical protein